MKESYEKLITEAMMLDDPQWEDAVMPDVIKYGKEADRQIKNLQSYINKLNTEVAMHKHDQATAKEPMVFG